MVKKFLAIFGVLMLLVPGVGAQDGALEFTCSSTGREIEGDAGTVVTVSCPADCTTGSIWGTDTYTDDSSVCTAAVHAGALTTAGGTIEVQILAGQDGYPATEQNGIQSSSWSSWGRSFGFSNQSMPIMLECGTSTIEGAVPGDVFSVQCPANCEAGSIWGTNVYTDDSSICTAAAHIGAIDPAEGGVVDLVYVAGQDEYLASEQNGVTSYDWGSWDLSFTFAAPITCDTNAVDVGVEGDLFAVTCPAACDAGSVWGTGSYSTDSSICTAAAHAGVISLEAGGTFLLELTAGQETYPASEQNGIASSEWGTWDLSMVPRSLEMVQLSCDATANQFEGESGESFTAVCPAACAAGSIWGTNVYTDDSNICTAAAHAGAITLEEGGTVVVTFAEGKESYSATVANGIESSSWGAWSRSFIIGQ